MVRPLDRLPSDSLIIPAVQPCNGDSGRERSILSVEWVDTDVQDKTYAHKLDKSDYLNPIAGHHMHNLTNENMRSPMT